MIKRTLVLVAVIFLIAGVTAGCAPRPRLPLIGITSVYKVDVQNKSTAAVSTDFAYVKAVLESQAVPIILPTVNSDTVICRYVRELDGLILIGGRDVPPSAYGEKPLEQVDVMPARRFDFERKLIRTWFRTGKPMLGICLGAQFTNVVQGGTLIQDIPSQVGTTVVHRARAAKHRIRIEPGSRLRKILGLDETVVNSNHHQAVNKLGRCLKVVARSDDGVVEALERTDGHFGVFVQWHPEIIADPAHRKAIFNALVQSCKVRN